MDDVVTRMNYDVARDLSHQFTLELLDEIEKLPPVFPQRITELAEKIRETDRIAQGLRRRLLMEVAG